MRALTRAVMRAPNEETERGQGGRWWHRAARGRLVEWLASNESPQPTRSIATGTQARRWLAVFRLLGKATVVK